MADESRTEVRVTAVFDDQLTAAVDRSQQQVSSSFQRMGQNASGFGAAVGGAYSAMSQSIAQGRSVLEADSRARSQMVAAYQAAGQARAAFVASAQREAESLKYGSGLLGQFRHALDQVAASAQKLPSTIGGKLSGLLGGAGVGGFIKQAAASAVGFGTFQVGMMAGQAFGKMLDDVSRKALETEAATIRLNTALRLTGQESSSSLSILQRQADTYERLTGVQDEAVQEAQSLAMTLGHATVPETLNLTRVAMNLSSALQTDLSTAMLMIVKASEGSAGGLRRLGIEFKATGNDAEDTRRLIELLDERLGREFATENVGRLAKEIAKNKAAVEDNNKALAKMGGDLPTVESQLQRFWSDALVNILRVSGETARWIDMLKNMPTTFVLNVTLPRTLNAMAGQGSYMTPGALPYGPTGAAAFQPQAPFRPVAPFTPPGQGTIDWMTVEATRQAKEDEIRKKATELLPKVQALIPGATVEGIMVSLRAQESLKGLSDKQKELAAQAEAEATRIGGDLRGAVERATGKTRKQILEEAAGESEAQRAVARSIAAPIAGNRELPYLSALPEEFRDALNALEDFKEGIRKLPKDLQEVTPDLALLSKELASGVDPLTAWTNAIYATMGAQAQAVRDQERFAALLERAAEQTRKHLEDISKHYYNTANIAKSGARSIIGAIRESLSGSQSLFQALRDAAISFADSMIQTFIDAFIESMAKAAVRKAQQKFIDTAFQVAFMLSAPTPAVEPVTEPAYARRAAGVTTYNVTVNVDSPGFTDAIKSGNKTELERAVRVLVDHHVMPRLRYNAERGYF